MVAGEVWIDFLYSLYCKKITLIFLSRRSVIEFEVFLEVHFFLFFSFHFFLHIHSWETTSVEYLTCPMTLNVQLLLSKFFDIYVWNKNSHQNHSGVERTTCWVTNSFKELILDFSPKNSPVECIIYLFIYYIPTTSHSKRFSPIVSRFLSPFCFRFCISEVV